MLSKISQKEKDEYHMISLIFGILNMKLTNKHDKTEETHGYREQTTNCKRGEGWKDE